jgi:hypothetical protein
LGSEEYKVTGKGKKQRDEKESGGRSERQYIWRGGRLYLRFEGSQAVPAGPSGRGNAYDRNYFI